MQKRRLKSSGMAVGSARFKDATLLSVDTLVPWYLMASVAYYHWDASLLEDAEYDILCTDILRKWNAITHPHKRFIDRTSLAAGTGYAIPEWKYPTITKEAAWQLLYPGTRRPYDKFLDLI